MSDTQHFDPSVYANAKSPNPARSALAVIGVLLVAAGILVVSIASGNVSHDQSVSAYTSALSGGTVNNPNAALAGDYLGLWVGVGIGVFGLLLITARLIISAARRQGP
jgi:hypothetical protein